jgi:putative intracellular protease/amidase
MARRLFRLLAALGSALLLAPALAQDSGIAPYQPRAGHTRPLVAVVGMNEGTEVADFVVPYGILSRSGTADVVALATGPGPMKMRPALTLEPQATTEQFDRQHPEGADYVVVPAVDMHKTGDPALVGWIRAQAGLGATVVSICDGALVVAQAGLFKDRQATGHWATQELRERQFPDTRWLKNTRYVADGPVISSAGVSAAIPLSIALVEAFGGRERAAATAEALGVADWSARHDSSPFRMTLRDYLAAAGNGLLASPQVFALPVAEGVDEVTLALVADALSRTSRSRALSLAAGSAPVHTRYGLQLVPDRIEGEGPASPRPLTPLDALPAAALDKALDEIAGAYGSATARLVRLQMEYPEH